MVTASRLRNIVTWALILGNLVDAWAPQPSSTSRSALHSQSSPSRGRRLTAVSFDDLIETVSNFFQIKSSTINQSQSLSALERKAQEFLSNIFHYNHLEKALDMVATDATWEDTNFYETCDTSDTIQRRLRLASDATPNLRIVVDETVVDGSTVALQVHRETNDGFSTENGRGAVLLTFNDCDQIQKVFWVQESANKAGEKGLNLLRGASKIIEVTGASTASENNKNKESDVQTEADIVTRRPAKSSSVMTAPEKYFAAWNRRDMEAAVDVFDDGCTYDDTAFPIPFQGKIKLREHLYKCAACFPPTFSFQVDDVVNGGDAVAVKWHVENNGEELPFTRGLSFYRVNANGKIQDGIDFVEPAVVKPGDKDLWTNSMKTKISQEPVRLVPIAVWLTYMYVVFFSDGILPGANALALEQRTWEEVRDLSLNFFLVSPLLHLPFAPVVHPMLEGVFNLLLSWAAMFAGFLSDDRKDKPNLFPMFPAVVGMQFLTSAFLLPYLATRSSETRTDVATSDLSKPAQVLESPLLGTFMSIVGTGSIVWAILARSADFGDLSTRWTSFMELLSIDRVGSSFIVDLMIFGLFQWWLIDDDMKRRGADSALLRAVGKYVPFFGMAAYLAFRPTLSETPTRVASTDAFP